jgi:hypothetical protein
LIYVVMAFCASFVGTNFAFAETLDCTSSSSDPLCNRTDPIGSSSDVFAYPNAPSGNIVTIINNNDETGSVYGGVKKVTAQVIVQENKIYVTKSDIGKDVIGGYAKSDADASAGSNTVNISESTIGSDVHGGYAISSNGAASAVRNIVTFENNSDADYLDGGISNGKTYSTASFNVVNVNNINNNQILIVEGTASGADGAIIITEGNQVFVNNSTASFLVGSYQLEIDNVTSSSNDNIVKIENSTVETVIGSIIEAGGNSSRSHVGNSVEINDSNADIVYLVYSRTEGEGGTIQFDNNSLTLSGNTAITKDVYGDYFDDLSTVTRTVSGNALNIRRPKAGGITIGGDLKNFQILNFFLPDTFAAGDTMLKVGGTAEIDDNEVNVGIEGSSSPLKAGDEVTLIDASAGILSGTPRNRSSNGQGMQGVSLLYDFDIYTQNNKLLARVAGVGPSVNPQVKALSEGFLSGMGLMIMGADTLADQGIAGAVDAAKAGAAREGFGLAGFGTVSGGRIRYNTGSHVDVSGFSLLAGLSLGQDLTPGRLTLGAFFEYGLGDYNTYNSFSNAASAHGGGDTSYVGGGILGHFAFIDTGPGHFYAEATARMGRVESDFSSSDIRDINGRKADYDSESLYYGLHFGAGYVWNITDAASLACTVNTSGPGRKAILPDCLPAIPFTLMPSTRTAYGLAVVLPML